jgi:ferrochelatase
MRKAVLIVNLGTPAGPGVVPVSRYLMQFLNDRRVIDLPWLVRKILVNVIIIPFRARKSSRLYKRLWTAEGSPLLIYLNNMVAKLALKMKGEYAVYGAMRYGNPSLGSVLQEIRKVGYDQLTVFPLFPQYASSTTGSVAGYIMKHLGNWEVIPKLILIDQYYRNPVFIRAFSASMAGYHPQEFDHVLFSYHGLPLRQINKVHPGIHCSNCTCDTGMPAHGLHCYRAACYETTRLLTEQLRLPENLYSTAFQSRLSKNWLTPFADDTLVDLARKGCKKILVVAPSFVADCLETTIEIGEDYKALFIKNGGKQLVLAESLNDRDEWVDALDEMIRKTG